MLRPFFKPTRKGSLDGWKFSLDDDEGNLYLHGANPGTAQEHTPDHHPHLRLEETMIPFPTVEPGDTGKGVLVLSIDCSMECIDYMLISDSFLECRYDTRNREQEYRRC